MKVKRTRIATLPEDYKNMGVSPNHTEIWEDGLRTNGKEGSYEWWYFDSEFEGGLTVVSTFYTKDHFDAKGPAYPMVDIDVTYPDGTKRRAKSLGIKGTVINASKEKCDVTINKSYLRMEDDGKYRFHFDDEGIVFDAIITNTVPPYRTKAGNIYFGDNDEHYFAWFVAQPAATIEATLTIDGKTKKMKGKSYHDHNWGNVEMFSLMSHWYWGRAEVGDYNVIACDIVAGKKYGYIRQPVFMLAKDGKIIADDPSKVAIERRDRITQPITKKFMDNHLTYTYPISDNEKYIVEFIRKKEIVAISLLAKLPKIKASFAKLIGINPTYCRVLGEVKITHELDGNKEVVSSQGLWEQMFFDNNLKGEMHKNPQDC